MPNIRPLTASLSLLAVAIVGLTPAVYVPRVEAQDPPASTYQPGFWQPIGRFDPKKPVKVKLVNNTDLALDFDITNLESMPPDVVAPGESAMIENFGNNAYIMVYPDNATPSTPEQSFVLKFTVPVDARTQMVGADNVAVITVTKGDVNIEERFYGHRSINLQPTGAIFFY
ncbi:MULTISPECIES: hypothetical protein [unclassified Synechocystis]|uniref:hypothetical protein n=1 Tax=unclassified Synechocystis TaxID=2640012 RepID=UPI00041E256A|nr:MULTISPECIES: hypothetical protein [unclassified Synechocystis]AIE74983.1 hypothetical protein D082_24550 [Synechocystis sp. PCC 6714]MCT0253307.1 hypothetical protein [Synechocystis sp. CS-94]